MNCPSCGIKAISDARFCRSCGQAMPPGVQAAAAEHFFAAGEAILQGFRGLAPAPRAVASYVETDASRPLFEVLVTIYLGFCGVVAVISGLMAAAAGPIVQEARQLFSMGDSSGQTTTLTGLLLVIGGFLSLAAAYGIGSRQSWARTLALTLLVPAALLSLFGLFNSSANASTNLLNLFFLACTVSSFFYVFRKVN